MLPPLWLSDFFLSIIVRKETEKSASQAGDIIVVVNMVTTLVTLMF